MARQIVIKDKNLKPENIKQGVKILNVTGTYEGGGPSDVEQWPDLLQVYNDESGVHGGVTFDTGFPIADGLVNNHFEGYFALGQSMEYMEEHSCFLFGNSSAVDPEIGGAYYWGIWQAYGNINVAFGSRSDYAVFPLSEDGEEGTVSPYDLPVKWERMKNVDPKATGFDSDYVYEVKIGNLVKYAPAHDERLKLFNGLNMCVFGRNVEGDPEVYSGHADSGTKSTCIYTESTDEDEISHDLDLTPYKLNDSVTFYETCNINGETEYSGPLEPILDTHGTVSNISFDVDMGTDLQVMPSDEEQHIATINGETIFPYVTVKAAGGGNDWVLEAKAGNITDLSAYSLDIVCPIKEGAKGLFKDSSITNAPSVNNVSIGNSALYECFMNCSSLVSVSFNMTSSGDFNNLESTCNNCTSLVSIEFPNLTYAGYQAMRNICYNCTSLKTVSFPVLTNIGNYTFSQGFNGCNNVESITVHPYVLSINDTNRNFTQQFGSQATKLTSLILTDTANKDIYISTLQYLDAASVLNVLTHLDLTVSGKSVNFYSSGLTITDDAQGSIQTAYDAAVAAGWTINNLTILPFSE